jgi:hypothetical protein
VVDRSWCSGDLPSATSTRQYFGIAELLACRREGVLSECSGLKDLVSHRSDIGLFCSDTRIVPAAQPDHDVVIGYGIKP